MFRALRAHHQERQIALIQLLVTVTPCWWQCRVLVGSLHIGKNLCVKLVTYQESLHDARPTKR